VRRECRLRGKQKMEKRRKDRQKQRKGGNERRGTWKKDA